MFKFVRCSLRVSLWRLPRLVSLVLVTSLTALMGPVAKAASIVSDFSITGNPNGVWSNYYGTGPTTQTAYTASQGVADFPSSGLPGWWNGGGIPDAISIMQNTTGAPRSFETIIQPTDTLLLDPEEYSVAVVFTAPVANTYDIIGNFLGIDVDQNAHPVRILDNGAAIYSNTISSYGQSDGFNLVENLLPGDTISFYVGTGSTGCSYCYLSTGLAGTVTPASASTPEPSGLGLLIGAAVLAGAWRAIPGFARQRGSSR